MIAQQRSLAAGIALGAALEVKLVPVLLVLPFALAVWRPATPQPALRFAAGLGLALLPLAPFVLVQPMDFYQATLGYGSQFNRWGVMALIHATSMNPDFTQSAQAWGRTWLAMGRYVLLGSVVLVSIVGYWRRTFSPPQLGALVFALFLTVAPGFAIQYLIYLLPMLLVADPRRGLHYSWLAGAFAATVYFVTWRGSFPAYSHFSGGFAHPAPMVGILAWAVVVAFLTTTWLRGLREPAPLHSPGSVGT